MSRPRLVLFYVRSDALGDGLMRIPALRAARAAFPDSRIVYVASGATSLATTLRRHVEPAVDEVRPHSTLPDVLAELRPRAGTAAVADFRPHAVWQLTTSLRLLPRRMTVEANFPGYALTGLRRGFGLRPEHNAWRYHRVVERLAGRPLPFDHRLSVLPEAREQAARIRGDGQRPLVLLGGNAVAAKALATEQLVPVARELLQRGCAVVYLHSPGEGPNGAELAARVPGVAVAGPEPVLDGVPLLEVFLALGSVADAYLGPEGGLAHCMAGLLTPVVLVNHWAHMRRWRPLSGLVEVIEARDVAPGGLPADTPPALLLQALDRLLAARDRHAATARDAPAPAARRLVPLG